MKRISILLAGLFLFCAASPPEPSPVPAALQRYVKDGRLDPGDYGWIRGQFSEASPEDEVAFWEVMRWQDQCLQDGQSRTRIALQAMGIADPKIDLLAGSPLLCLMVVSRPFRPKEMTFGQFQQIRDRILPIAETYLVATRLAASIGGPRGPALSDALTARTLGDQMLRASMNWGQGQMADVPKLTPQERKMFTARIGMEIRVLDHDNTEWLKKIVTEQGWPKISQVGERASQQAWLLVQHADADPVFQLQTLRLMEPLLETNEVSKQNYAYLYDRIMLKLNGKQRYASQMLCVRGKRVPLPLESEKAVDGYRAEMGMSTLAEYAKQMDERDGACPSA